MRSWLLFPVRLHCVNIADFTSEPNIGNQLWNCINMGIKGIRTALKVDLNKPAREQSGLHVCPYLAMTAHRC